MVVTYMGAIAHPETNSPSQHGTYTDTVVTIVKPQTMEGRNTPIVFSVVPQPIASGTHGRHHEPFKRHLVPRMADVSHLAPECLSGCPVKRKSHMEQRSIRSTIKDMGDIWRPRLGSSDPARAVVNGGGHMAAALVPCIGMNACRERL